MAHYHGSDTPTSPRAVLHHTDVNLCTILHTTVYKKSLEISISFFFKNYSIRGFPVTFMKDEPRIFKMVAKVMQVSNVSPSPYWGWAQAYN